MQFASWHHGWWKIANGLSGGDLSDPLVLDRSDLAQRPDNSTGLNAFAFWANATGGTPRIYGIGSMEAYVRLPGGLASEFYLAQVEAAHAGKTLTIQLWDPGDTGSLAANLQILQPTGSGFHAGLLQLPRRPRHDRGAASLQRPVAGPASPP